MALTPQPMIVNKCEVSRMIEKAIREHELRVAIVSGIGGLVLLAGTWHAILLVAKG